MILIKKDKIMSKIFFDSGIFLYGISTGVSGHCRRTIQQDKNT
jgi:hypothetical protein